MVVMGQQVSGDWALWVVTQGDDAQVVPLPGPLLACPPAETVALRAEPSEAAEVSGQAARAQTFDADRFVLTTPGTEDAPGDGWYRVSGVAEGWVSSANVVDAALGSCSAGSAGDGGGTVG